MKFLIVAVILGFVAAASADWTEEQKKGYEEATKTCSDEFGVNLDELKKSKHAGVVPEDETTKKFLFCVLKKLDQMTEDGDFEIDSIKHTLTTAFGDDGAKLADLCTAKKGDNALDTAYNYSKCLTEYIVKHHQH